ncbi:glutathione ABC transporter substrate-binding protein [Scopulibacillus cellulosilyticus]|uniref:Glutathione-binding protein GsiB n=1 Tax=Scopulibacillus cellulosilyticus TaxID=2665665 RepID=A0ABW2Q278_9BACL
MKRRLFIIFSILIILSLVLAGCGSKGASGSKEGSGTSVKKKGKDITIAVQSNFISMDPQDTNDTQGYSAQKTMMEGLLGFDKNMKVIPVLAKSYKVSDDAKEFTFYLRKGIKFQDGTPFNAEAVKVNIDRVSNPANKLKRYSLFSLVKETKVINDYTVEVILKKPFGAMINNFAHPAGMMMSPKAIKKYGKDIGRHPVGTGPYEFVDWKQGDHLTVKKNPHYWRKGYPKLNSITFKPVPENGSRIDMLKTGEADFIYPVPTEEAKKINGKNGIEMISKPSIVVDYMSMNTMKKPFNNLKVRQAINYAINKPAFLKVVLNGYGQPLDSVLAPQVQFYSKQNVYKYDPEKAKKLLKEAGYGDGFTATLWGDNNSQAMKAMQFIQQQLGLVNIKVKVTPMESGTMDNKIWSVQNPKDADIQLYYGGWSPSTGDADWGIRPLLGGESFPPNSYNTAYYKNDKVDQLINQALQTADPKVRGEAYKKAQADIWKDAPWAFLATANTMFAKQSYLKGIYLLPDGSLDVNQAEIKN